MNYSYDSGQYIIFDEKKIDKPKLDWFESDYWYQQHAVIGQAQGRGQALFIQHQGQDWVLRHYQRGGLAQKISQDLYSWWGFENTRMYREFCVLNLLAEKGIPVAPPVAARVCRHGLGYRGDIITKRIASSQDLASYLGEKKLPESLWYRLGQRIAQLHAAGVKHPDLNARNILIVQNSDCAFIDFDPTLTLSYRDNIRRFLRSLHKLQKYNTRLHFTQNDWRTLCSGYTQGLE